MEKKKQNITRLIASAVLGIKPSAEEQKILDDWLKNNTRNQRVFEEVQTLRDADEILELERKGYPLHMATRVLQQIEENQKHSKHYWIKWISGVAAVLAVTIFILTWSHDKSIKQPLAQSESTEQIVPGKVEAILTLANGEKLHITDTTNIEILHNKLVTSDSTTYNTLTVPPAGEFFYTLSDGTQVWINSDSELQFPANFETSKRQVKLRGEAFFNVTHNQQRPFVVSLSEGDITVYGTRFNVSNYEDSDLSAVLVEGCIGFCSKHGDSVLLNPSEQMIYKEDKDEISVKKVDTELYTSWINHRFVFKEQTLEEIMTTLSRWYGFSVRFADKDVRSIRLSGRLNRYDDIRVLLYSYEEVANIHFDIQGREIIISQKDK